MGISVSPKIKATLVAAGLVGVMGVYWVSYSDFLEQGRRPPEGTQILNKIEKEGLPDFDVEDINGEEVSLQRFRGKLVILNFWASWCDPCVAEFPSMMALLKKFGDRVVLIAISADYEEADIHNFLKALQVEHPNLYVVWDKDQAIAKKFGTFRLPESYIIGKKGELIRKVSGVDDWATPEAFAYFEDLDGAMNNKKQQ